MKMTQLKYFKVSVKERTTTFPRYVVKSFDLFLYKQTIYKRWNLSKPNLDKAE